MKKQAKTDDPGPTSYNNTAAHSFAYDNRGKMQIGKTDRVSFAE